VVAGDKQLFRFRSEFRPGHGSWIAVLVTYVFGAAILFALAQFLINFERFGTETHRVGLQTQDAAALTQLLHELNDPISREEMGKVISRFEARYSDDRTVRVEPSRARGARDATELLDAYREGKPRTRIVELAEARSDAEMAAAKKAMQRLERSKLAVRAYAALLGIAVVLCVFGGGLLFLRRSRHLEHLLQQRAAELDEVDASRRLFFAKASHELRTPVTTIRGEAEMALADAEDIEAIRQALEHINATAKFLNHRIEEMIGIARASDGKLHLDASHVDFRTIVEGAIQDAGAFAASVSVSIRKTLPDDPVDVVGDAIWLKRALLAVIENALKFSPMDGQVNVTLAERSGMAEITVTDNGPGVMPDELPLLFDAYYQTDAGKARGGSGLGLAMTRWVAEQHDGRAYARNIGSWRRPDGCAVTVAIKLERAS
jgi:signal transduction histidine kinase